MRERCRRLRRALVRTSAVGALAAAALAGPVAAAARTEALAACDGNRLLGLLERTTLQTPGSAGAGLDLTLAPSGAFDGVAYAATPDGRETLLAFTVSFETSTLLRNPARPQLSSVTVSRDDLVTDRLGDPVGAGAAGLVRVTIDPTFLPAPDPSTQIVLDNRTVAGGEAVSRPGRGLDHLVAPCHGPLTDAEVQVLRVLARTVRIGGADQAGSGAVALVAIYPRVSAEEVRIDAYLADPGGAGGPLHAAPRLSARVRITRDGAGRLLGGTLRVLPACAAGEAGWDCSTAPAGTVLTLRPPTFHAPPGAPGPSAAVAADGAGEQVPVEWTVLLDGSTWREPLERPAPSLALELAGGPLVAVFAHPDDEVLLAPLLGEVCVELDGRCTLVVATRGERGSCLLPAGCHPDVATVRETEMARAAGRFDAVLVPWDLGDGTAPSPAGVRAAWVAAAGGEAALLDRIAGEIVAAQDAAHLIGGAGGSGGAGAVLTFDPRHGSTGHADHRAIGQLVLDAVARLPADRRPAIYLLETRATLGEDDTVTLGPDGTASPLVSFDATRWMVRRGAPAWQYLLDDARIHRSQFSPTLVENLAAIARPWRRVWLLLAPVGGP